MSAVGTHRRVETLCRVCGGLFMALAFIVKRGAGACCSRACATREALVTGRLKRAGEARATHGHSRVGLNGHGKSLTYVSWSQMRQRCLNPTCKQYVWYGARGIGIHARWASFDAFLADMGERPSAGHSIDRIDVNGHYEPSNCRWADAVTQAANKRTSRLDFIDRVQAVYLVSECGYPQTTVARAFGVSNFAIQGKVSAASRNPSLVTDWLRRAS